MIKFCYQYQFEIKKVNPKDVLSLNQQFTTHTYSLIFRDKSPNTESGKKTPNQYDGIINNLSQQFGSEKIIQTKISSERQFLGQNLEVVCFLLAFNLDIKDNELDALIKNRKELAENQREDKRKIKSLEDELQKSKLKQEKEVKTFNLQLQDKDRYIQELLNKQEQQKRDKQQLEQQYEEYLDEQKQRLELERKTQEEKYQQKILEMEQDIAEIHRKNNQMQYQHEEKIKNLYQKHTEENQSSLVRYQVMEKQLETIKHQHSEEITKYTLIQEELTSKYNKIFEQNIEIKHQLEVKENQIIKINSELKDQEIRFMEEKQKYSSFSKEQTILDNQIQSLNNDIEEWKRKNKKLEKEFKELQNENSQLVKDINKEKLEKSEYNDKYQGLERQLNLSEQNYKQLHNENDQLLNEIEELKSNIENLEHESEQKLSEINEYRTQINDLITNNQNLENENNSLTIEKNQFQEYYDQQLEENKNLQKKQESLEVKLSYTSTQIQMLDVKDSRNKKQIKDLEEEKLKNQAQIKDLQNQLKLKDEEIEKFNLIVKELNEEIERLKKLITQFQENANLKTEADKQIQNLMSQLLVKEEEINQLQKKITELELVQIRYQDSLEKYKILENEYKDLTNAISQINSLNILNQKQLPEYKYFSRFIDTFNTTLQQLQIHYNIEQDISCIGILKSLESRINNENQKIVNYEIKIFEYTEKIKIIEQAQPQKMDKFNTDIQNDLVNANILQVRPNTIYSIFNHGFNEQVSTLLKQFYIEQNCSVYDGFKMIYERLQLSEKNIQHKDIELSGAIQAQQYLSDEINQLKQIIEKMEQEQLLLKSQYDQVNADIDFFIKNKNLITWKQEEQEGCLKLLVQNFISEKSALFELYQLNTGSSIKDVMIQLTDQIKQQKSKIAQLEEELKIKDDKYNELIQTNEQAKIDDQNNLNEALKQVGTSIFYNKQEIVEINQTNIYKNVYNTLNEIKVNVYNQLQIESHLSIEQAIKQLQERILQQEKQLVQKDNIIGDQKTEIIDLKQKLQNEIKRKATLRIQLEEINKSDKDFNQIKDQNIRDAVKIEMRKQIEKLQNTSLFDLSGHEDRENIFINEYLNQKEKLLCDLDLDNDSTIRQLLKSKSRTSSQIGGQKREFFTFTVNDKFILEVIIKTFEQGEDLTSHYIRQHIASIKNVILAKVVLIFINKITALSYQLSKAKEEQNKIEVQPIQQQNKDSDKFDQQVFMHIKQLIDKTDFQIIRGPYRLTGYVLKDEIMKKVEKEFQEYQDEYKYSRTKLNSIHDLIVHQKNMINEFDEEITIQRNRYYDYQQMIQEKIQLFYEKGEIDEFRKDDKILSYVYKYDQINKNYQIQVNEFLNDLQQLEDINEIPQIVVPPESILFNLIERIQILIKAQDLKLNETLQQLNYQLQFGILFNQMPNQEEDDEENIIEIPPLDQTVINLKIQQEKLTQDIINLLGISSFNNQVEFQSFIFKQIYIHCVKTYHKTNQIQWQYIQNVLMNQINMKNHHKYNGRGIIGSIVNIFNSKLLEVISKLKQIVQFDGIISFEEIIDKLIIKCNTLSEIEQIYSQKIENTNFNIYDGNDKILVAVKQKIFNEQQTFIKQEFNSINSWIQQFNYQCVAQNEIQHLIQQWFINQKGLIYQEALNHHFGHLEKLAENIQKGIQIGGTQLEKIIFQQFQQIDQQTLKERQEYLKFFQFVEHYQYDSNFQSQNQLEIKYHKQIERYREFLFKKILNSIERNQYDQSREDIAIQQAVDARLLIKRSLEEKFTAEQCIIILLQQYVNMQYAFGNQLINNLTILSNAFSRVQKKQTYKDDIQKYTLSMKQQKEEFIQKFTQLEKLQPSTKLGELLELSIKIMQDQQKFIEGYSDSFRNKILVIAKEN
ncbi:hypothetical protein pb186bvf_008780 [Paramecium bursaria]